MMNNIMQLRIQLEKVFDQMGGEKLDKQSTEILNNLQGRLNTVLDRLSAAFVATYVTTLLQRVNMRRCCNFCFIPLHIIVLFL